MKPHYLFPSLIITDQINSDDIRLVKEEIEAIFPEINKLLSGDCWGDNVYSTSKTCKCLITSYNLQNTLRVIYPIIKELAIQHNIVLEELKLKDSWINITTHFGYQDLHLHGHNVLSGVIYLNVPLNSGVIQFSPPICDSYFKPLVSFTPKKGFITAFHGSIPHKVTYNKTDKQRISLSFNYEYTL
jgi:uncharacterized protein (TIGR02466 family)